MYKLRVYACDACDSMCIQYHFPLNTSEIKYINITKYNYDTLVEIILGEQLSIVKMKYINIIYKVINIIYKDINIF